ncbi:MAG: PDZ domain-containing protein [Oscillospiraceae bacterium]|nr:PDZ domain-containing protein [Oscillospiraceae bacterium]
MNKKVSVGITAAFIFIAVTITFTATMIYAMNLFDQKILSVQERASMYDKISEIDSAVRQNFYAGVDDDQMIAGMTEGYIDSLGDPDTRYMKPAEISAMQQSIQGKSVGVGLFVEENASGYAVVSKVVPNSAADKVGMQAGDVIISVNGEDALVMGFAAVEKLMTGIEGEQVALGYTREGEEESAELVYTIIENTSVYYYDLDGYFYIRLTDLNALTVSQFDYALNYGYTIEGLKGFVFDVRSLSTGYDLSIAAEILDLIVGQGTLVSGVYANEVTKVLYTSDAEQITLPAVVLVDGSTRGYGELFAAAVGENERVRIVGDQTAGKGTHQELVQFTDGSGVYVTTCRLLACGVADFNETGVTPDFIVSATEEFVLTEEQPDPVADLQLRKALEVLESEFGA